VSAETILEVHDLHKTFRIGFFRKKVRALSGVGFSVQRGEIFGYVGPNGAGKTTSIKCMLQLIYPDRGKVSIFGRPTGDPAARRRLGYLPESPYIYTYLKPLEFLDLCGRLTGLDGATRRKRSAELLEQLSLTHAVDRPIGRFSKGMMQRLGVCQALLHDPELLILDEPFSGLDPLGRRDIRELLLDQKKQGKTLVFTSHVLSDVEALCDRVAIVQRGSLVACGTIHQLLKPEVQTVEVELTGVNAELRAALVALAKSVREVAPQVLVTLEGDGKVPELLALVARHGAQVHSVIPHRETLEDVFVRHDAQLREASGGDGGGEGRAA
jgi:ABC-2 type transport system ATP-binding protein